VPTTAAERVADSLFSDPGKLVAIAREAEGKGQLATALGFYVRALALKPNDAALYGEAGRLALAIGDGDAAFGFYVRAVQLEPRNGRLRADVGRALNATMRPKEALNLFGQAVRLGEKEEDIAGDRGLSRDLLGESRKAQRDYALALAGHPGDVAITQRLALSMAISGDRAAAIALMGPLVQRGGTGEARRTLAFVHALTGDVGSARKLAEVAMPAEQAATMSLFFARLPYLSSEDKALAAHFGRLPASKALAEKTRAVPARAKVKDQDPLAARVNATGDKMPQLDPPEERIALAEPVRSDKQAGGKEDKAQPVDEAVSKSSAVPETRCETVTGRSARAQCLADARALERRCGGPKPPKTAECKAYKTKPVEEAVKTKAAVPEAPCEAVTGRSAHAQCLADVRALERRCGGPKPPRTAECKAYAAQGNTGPGEQKSGKKGSPKPEKAKPKHPSRIWVQVAGGANAAALPKEWQRLKTKVPALLGKQTAYWAPVKATNRLLIGPFKDNAAANDLVNELKKAGLSGFRFTSADGDEITPLATK